MQRRRIVRDRWKGLGTRARRTGRRHGEHGDLLAAISLHQGVLLVSIMWTMGIGASYLHQHGTSTFSQVPQLTLIWTWSRSKWVGVPVPTTYLRSLEWSFEVLRLSLRRRMECTYVWCTISNLAVVPSWRTRLAIFVQIRALTVKIQRQTPRQISPIRISIKHFNIVVWSKTTTQNEFGLKLFQPSISTKENSW